MYIMAHLRQATHFEITSLFKFNGYRERVVEPSGIKT